MNLTAFVLIAGLARGLPPPTRETDASQEVAQGHTEALSRAGGVEEIATLPTVTLMATKGRLAREVGCVADGVLQADTFVVVTLLFGAAVCVLLAVGGVYTFLREALLSALAVLWGVAIVGGDAAAP